MYSITATVTGRFDKFETNTVSVRKTPSTKAFHYSGMQDAPLSRFVLQAVIEVSAVPMNPSVYSESKRRNLSLEEASDLVFAYLKSTGGNQENCSLVPYHPPDAPDLYHFQGISTDPSRGFNLGYFAIDPTTADIWSGVFCERLVSKDLTSLQRIIRRRIGLSAQEYKKAKKPGPFCEPGMPRARHHD